MIDEIDRSIIEILNKDGRITNKEISSILAISEGTVRNRISKLTSSGYLTVKGLINPDIIDEKELIVLGVNIIKTKDLCRKATQISELDEVVSVLITGGRFDMLVEAWVDVKHGLIDFISQKLAKIEGISATESFIVMKSYNKYLAVNK